MTSKQQSKKFYTQEQLQQILDVIRENAVYDDGDFYFKVDVDKITKVIHALEPIRSLQHTPAPSHITHTRFEKDGLHYRIDNGIEDIISLSEHDAQIAKAAHEEFAQQICNYLKKRSESLERSYPIGHDQRDGARTRISEIEQTVIMLDAMKSSYSLQDVRE